MDAPTSARAKTRTARTPDDDEVNPFQVYPVRGLAELRDVRAATVRTPEVTQVHDAVEAFVAGFMTDQIPPARLLLAAKGDFGTGKTHLMLYARSLLVSEMAALQKQRDDDRKERGLPPASPGETLAPLVTLAVSSEAPIEAWYASELGPSLIEVASPRELVRELLTRIACDVAAADLDPDIAGLAQTFRGSRRALYQMFRDPGAFDISEVESRFTAEIAAACPRTSRSFRRVIEALRWEETAELAEDWLAGNELSDSDMARIGLRLEGDPATRAANAVCAIASLSRRLGRPFGLFIDEFEHLTRFDSGNQSKRNITWVKRLVDSLARRGAMVFISGHWDAWEQRDDFLDRFVGGRPIQLVRLDKKDVMQVVEVRAGPKAWPGFTLESAHAVIETTSGNIRRVMTVLYDLWDDQTLTATDFVTPEAVRQAAFRRLQPGSEAGILPTIEQAVLANGGSFSREESFGTPPAPIDALARLGPDLRLIVRLIHARDELALLDGGEKFARLVKDTRLTNPRVRGLCVTLGAVIERHVVTLDAAFPETDLVNGEAPDVIQRLPGLIAAALARAPEATPAPDVASLRALEQTRDGAIDRADAQVARSQQVFGSDARSEAVRQASVPDPLELAEQKSERAREDTYHLLINDAERPTLARFVSALMGASLPLGVTVVTFLTILGTAILGTWRAQAMNAADSGYLPEFLRFPWTIPALEAVSAVLMTADLILLVRLGLAVAEFRRFRIQTLRRLYADGVSARRLTQANDMIEQVLWREGPRHGRMEALTALSAMPPTAAVGRPTRARSAANESTPQPAASPEYPDAPASNLPASIFPASIFPAPIVQAIVPPAPDANSQQGTNA